MDIEMINDATKIVAIWVYATVSAAILFLVAVGAYYVSGKRR